VPGSVYLDLIEAGIIPDPFYGENEWQVRDVMRHDFCYSRVFSLPDDLINPVLVLEGIDSVATVYLNGNLLQNTKNMHRTYRIPIKKELLTETNEIRIVLSSPIKYVEEKVAEAKHDLYHASYSIKGYVYLRKAHSMMGWDWGPQLPDAGIWRDIYLEDQSTPKISGLLVKQSFNNDFVTLEIKPELVVSESIEDAEVSFEVFDPEGTRLHQANQPLHENIEQSISISKPNLWYPTGYGEQPLYTVKIEIHSGGVKVSSHSEKIGFRQIDVIQDEDIYGKSFTIAVNKIKIFAKGANYIIEDNLLGRMQEEKTRALLEAAKAANHNTIRVWGGGIYPPDYFYAIADELGLLVWQDLMFACSVYELDQEFEREIHQEIKDNLSRIRNHACLALVCGNNENEEAITNWNVPSKEYSKESYVRQYLELIPKWVNEYAPGVFYWPSSPSSGDVFQNPNSDNYGDMHYWGVWHNTEAITNYRKHFPRFMSEFGLQSFPSLETVKTFAEPEDFNIFSKVMEHHQKNSTANSKILVYIGMMFRYPKDFSSLLYVSQLIQAEGIRYGVEHLRRNYGRCMGSLYWQLNDCWPVASWSGIDYYHRWKALHYHSRKFYEPCLLSLEENADQVAVFITNDTQESLDGVINWSFETFSGEVIEQGSQRAVASMMSSKCYRTFSFKLNSQLRATTVFRAEFIVSERIVSRNEVSFVPDKHLKLLKPTFSCSLFGKDKQYHLEIASDTYAKFIEVSIPGHDVVFSDNYFNILKNEKKMIDFYCDSPVNLTDIKIRSLYDSYQ
ncbi:MAG: glycoside hydrolase family 2 protein, partial [Candidatus Izemoplasmatales bacterium]